MKYQVIMTQSAQRDIARAADYIESVLKNPQAADALLDEIDRTAEMLAAFPESSALAKDRLLASWGIRFATVKGYLAFYVVDHPGKTVQLIRFLYGRSDWKSILRQNLTDPADPA